MTREELADALERAIARHDKACADGNVALTAVADVVVKSLIREGLPAILTALRGPAHDEAADRIELRMTCSACPEQYDAYLDGNRVGYLRLRNGIFRVDVPECGGPTVYRASPQGDGCFDDDEREHFLREAKLAIAAALRAAAP